MRPLSFVVGLAGLAATVATPALADGPYYWGGPRYGGPHYGAPPPYYYGRPREHHRYSNGDLAAAGALGLLGGAVIAGALMPPSPPPVYVAPQPVYVAPPPVYAPVQQVSPHQAWCQSRYRSYNAYNDTWIDNYGRLRYCVSPY